MRKKFYWIKITNFFFLLLCLTSTFWYILMIFDWTEKKQHTNLGSWSGQWSLKGSGLLHWLSLLYSLCSLLLMFGISHTMYDTCLNKFLYSKYNVASKCKQLFFAHPLHILYFSRNIFVWFYWLSKFLYSPRHKAKLECLPFTSYVFRWFLFFYILFT